MISISFYYFFDSDPTQRDSALTHCYSSYRFYDPPRFFSISAPLVSSLLTSYPVAFQVLVIYGNIRIVSRIQSRLVFRVIGSGSPSLTLSSLCCSSVIHQNNNND